MELELELELGLRVIYFGGLELGTGNLSKVFL